MFIHLTHWRYVRQLNDEFIVIRRIYSDMVVQATIGL